MYRIQCHRMFEVHDRFVEHLGSVRLKRFVRLVLSEVHMLRSHYGCVARDTCSFMVCLRNASVDDKELSSGLDRCFSLYDLDRHMAVQDAADFRVDAEFPEDLIGDLLFFDEPVVRNSMLFMSCLVCNEVPLKCSHLVFSEER